MAAIGIDLGTTYSCVAVCQDGVVSIIPNDIGKNTTPSHVAIEENGTAIVGEAAKNRADIKAENSIFDVKRLIGRRFDDPIVQNDIKYWPFKVINIKHSPIIQVHGRNYFPEQISAKVLAYLKKQAEEFLGSPVSDAVITVPAYFNDGQRQATKDAGEIAGLNVLRIINEPTAAAIAYNHQLKPEKLENILVFDLGGGTFDISVLEMQGNNMTVKAVGGDTHLGGEDFDNTIVEYCLQEFNKKHGVDLKSGKNSTNELERFRSTKNLRRLKNECEQQKINLTAARNTVVSLDAIHGELSMNVRLSREKFNELNQPFFRRCIEVLDKVLIDAGISKSTIDEIVLVGGSSKIPCVQEMIKQYFNNKLLSRVLRGDEAVAYGAALHASTMTKNETPGYSFKDVYPLPIGVKVKMVDRRDFSTVLPKNSPIPFSVTKTYYTVQNDQPAVKIAIYEGEEDLVSKNFFLGDFEMNLPPHTPKDTGFTVHMNLDEDGILHVKSEDPKSKTQRKLVVNETKGRLSQEDIANFKMEELEFYTFSSENLEY